MHIPGSADSEVSEEQKKEKVAKLKKKEKNLQDTLAQKIEELKKICMREAVSYSIQFSLFFIARDYAFFLRGLYNPCTHDIPVPGPHIGSGKTPQRHFT